jgi:hypothetical protein
MRKRRGSADHLVGLLRVNPKAEGQIDGLVELGFWKFDENLNGGVEGIGLVGVHEGQGLIVAFARHFGCGSCGPKSSRVND